MTRWCGTIAIGLGAAALVATCARAQRVTAADPRLALPPTVDPALRTEVERAVSSAALEDVLAGYPDQGAVLVPMIEAVSIDEIRSDGPGARFTVEEMTPNGGPARSVTLQTSEGRTTVIAEFPSDAVDAQGGVPSASFGDGSIHRYAGRIPLAPGIAIIGDGDRNHRLTFVILASYGMVYVRGTGRIVLAVDGQEKTIELGIPLQ